MEVHRGGAAAGQSTPGQGAASQVDGDGGACARYREARVDGTETVSWAWPQKTGPTYTRRGRETAGKLEQI